jgi:hypothetical protein
MARERAAAAAATLHAMLQNVLAAGSSRVLPKAELITEEPPEGN